MIDVKTGIILAAIGGAAVISSAVTWQVQDAFCEAKEKQRVEQELVDERLQAEVKQAADGKSISARDAAALRSADLRRAASRSNDALARMRNASNEAVRAAETSLSACVVTAAAERDVLQQCGEKYRDLAETADRHVSDLQTMIDANGP